VREAPGALLTPFVTHGRYRTLVRRGVRNKGKWRKYRAEIGLRSDLETGTYRDCRIFGDGTLALHEHHVVQPGVGLTVWKGRAEIDDVVIREMRLAEGK